MLCYTYSTKNSIVKTYELQNSKITPFYDDKLSS